MSSSAPRPVLFISDLHLSEAAPHTAAAFERFLGGVARDAQALYILGDLFEFWIGDEMLDTPFVARMAHALQALQRQGVALYVMHGNRDFLLGRRFLQLTGAKLLTDPQVVTVHGQRVVLAHGDALCTADLAYQRYRRVTRNRVVQGFFLRWPLRWRLDLATRMRRQSAAQGATRMAIADVTPTAVEALFRSSATTVMIHGHTHLCARHVQGASVRWVLPDWDLDHGAPHGGYLRVDETGFTLHGLAPTVPANATPTCRS